MEMKKSLSATAIAKKASQNAAVMAYDPVASARGIQAHKDYENAVARCLTLDCWFAFKTASYLTFL